AHDQAREVAAELCLFALMSIVLRRRWRAISGCYVCNLFDEGIGPGRDYGNPPFIELHDPEFGWGYNCKDFAPPIDVLVVLDAFDLGPDQNSLGVLSRTASST